MKTLFAIAIGSTLALAAAAQQAPTPAPLTPAPAISRPPPVVTLPGNYPVYLDPIDPLALVDLYQIPDASAAPEPLPAQGRPGGLGVTITGGDAGQPVGRGVTITGGSVDQPDVASPPPAQQVAPVINVPAAPTTTVPANPGAAVTNAPPQYP